MEEFKFNWDSSVYSKKSGKSEPVVKKSDTKLTLGWVGKKRQHKDPRELDKDFRQRFLNGELKVRRSFAIGNQNQVQHSNFNGDLEYAPR